MDSDYQAAPEYSIPKASFYSIEYPGYVEPQADSVARAMSTLGGPSRVEAAFRSSVQGNVKHRPLVPLELRFRPENPFAHPIPADMVNSGKLVLKVTTRRKRKRADAMDVDHQLPEVQSEYKAEVIGSVWKTARFRSTRRVTRVFG